MFPNNDELKLIQNALTYYDILQLGIAERFMLVLSSILNASEKLQIMIFISDFQHFKNVKFQILLIIIEIKFNIR